MNKILLVITFFIISSCFKSDIVQSQTANTDPAVCTMDKLSQRKFVATQIFVLSQKLVNFYLNMITRTGQIKKIILVIFQVSDS